MKRLFLLVAFLLGTYGFAQPWLELKQQWHVSEGENVWVVEIAEKITPELYRANLLDGNIPANHDLYVHIDVTENETAFTFMFNFLLATDSGFGFTCSVTPATAGELIRYVGSVGGPQWSDEKESCHVVLQSS